MRRYVKQLLCKKLKVREVKREPLVVRNVFAVSPPRQLWDVKRDLCIRAPAARSQ